MSGSLLEVKKKIIGVKNTRKITKAMQLVAASKMRQFQKKALTARNYTIDLYETLKQNLTAESKSIYSAIRPNGKTLFVIYTSDKGLCGPLNTKLLNTLVRSKKWIETPEEKRLLIAIGKKSANFAKSNNIPVEQSFVGLPEKFTTLDILKMIDPILTLWRKKGLKEVIFIAPHYKNSFTFYPVMKTFLPFSEEGIKKIIGISKGEVVEEDSKIHSNDEEIEETEETEIESDEDVSYQRDYMLFSPSKKHVVKSLYEQIIESMFIQSFLELKAAEYSSRMIAMQNATDAADRIVHDLNLTYNKARQQAITQEIAELIGASMALEG